MKLNNFCLIDLDYEYPKSVCLFDFWSIHHGYWHGLIYIIIHYILNIKSLKLSIIINIILVFLHAVEEYIDNNSLYSLQGFIIDNIGPIFDNKINPKMRKPDIDTIYNSIGDVISGLIISILIVIYWYNYKKLPLFYIFGLIPIIYMSLGKAHTLYSENNQ
tara:strand:- start:1945 stop:2427 length:483 start_codon:yes stop_codon:yes gene_type:complete